MDSIIRALKRRNQPVPVPLELPDEDQLLDIEEALYISLPKDYREFLLSVSHLVIGRLEPATAADPQSHTYLADMAANAWEQGLPREMIPICAQGRNFYCLNLENAVQLWTPQGFTEDEWGSVWEWAEAVWLQS